MGRMWVFVALCLGATPVLAGDAPPKPLVSGVRNPGAVAVADDGHIYVSQPGRILMLEKGAKAVPFSAGLDDPRGIVYRQKRLFVTDTKRVWRIDEKGNVDVLANKEAFPTEPLNLNGITADENGILYVSDSGDLKGKGGAIYRIGRDGEVKTVADTRSIPSLKTPAGLVMDGISHLLVLDSGSGELLRIRVADGTAIKLTDGFDGGSGLAWDWFGQLFITSRSQGKVWGIAQAGRPPVLLTSGFQAPGQLCLDETGKNMLVPDTAAGTVSLVPTTIPGFEVDTRPLQLQPAPAFPRLKWSGWEGISEDGKVHELRPVFLTHAGDGSGRNFVTIQQGIIHVFANDPKTEKTKVFLDIQKKVFYSDNQNEQGLLGVTERLKLGHP
jgi:DNA-binding beta-propeller fold protein YncE